MEFRFPLKPIFNQPIAKVNHNLLPHNFRGDRRTALDVSTKISEIVDKIGEYSAKAQGLSKPITSAQKLRNAENQNLYLLVDADAGHNGMVIGLLKVGTKSLYVFDSHGVTQNLTAPCVLDFYIHDSRQRSGLGKELFETMLAEEHWSPSKLAVDRPSEKLVGFMLKHYGLKNMIPQSNNFVIYDRFFEDSANDSVNKNTQNGAQMHITNSPNTALFGPHFVAATFNKRKPFKESASLTHLAQNSPVGRYAAPRPTCSMAEIIHSNSQPSSGEPNRSNYRRDTMADYIQHDKIHHVESACLEMENLHIVESHFDEPIIQSQPVIQSQPPKLVLELELDAVLPDIPDGDFDSEMENEFEMEAAGFKCQHDKNNEDIIDGQHIIRPNNFQPNKQHTGLKNISFNVGAAVTPSSKMEFDQEQREDFGVVKINRPPGKLQSPQQDNADAISTVSSGEGFTDQGYYDLKFYHNKLW